MAKPQEQLAEHSEPVETDVRPDRSVGDVHLEGTEWSLVQTKEYGEVLRVVDLKTGGVNNIILMDECELD